MTTCLKRYWFEYDVSQDEISRYSYLPLGYGYGITAYDYEDALRIMHHFLIRNNDLPKFSRVIENIDVSTLEDKNIISNMGVPVWRGVWFPAFNLWQGAYIER
jgi:hypothetical protein